MAMNSIGPYQFAVIQGVPGILSRAIETIERPNVAGTALRGSGEHGMAFVARTIEDVQSMSHGRQVLSAYTTLIGAAPVQMIVNDVDYFSNEGILVAVTAVTPIRLKRASTVVGGILPTGSSGAILYASWALKVIAA